MSSPPPPTFLPYNMVPIQHHDIHSSSLPGLHNNTINNKDSQNLNTFGKLGSPSLDDFLNDNNFEMNETHLTIDEDDQRKTFYSADSYPLSDSFVNFSNLDVHFIDS